MQLPEPYDVPADLDVAAVLASWLSRADIAERGHFAVMAENPLIGSMGAKEGEASVMLSHCAFVLSSLELRAAEQLCELLRSYDAGHAEPVESVRQRMSDIDQRRLTMLQHAASLASPFHLGPPAVVMSQLMDVMEVPSDAA